MKFDIKDRSNLEKIGVTSLLDLALLLPKKYDDLSVKNSPNEGENVVEIEIKYQTRKLNILQITAFCITWQCDVKIIIFNARKWHFAAFKSGQKVFIHAKSSFVYGSWQFINPKIVTKIGEILPHFKRDIKDQDIANLIHKYITYENLLSQGLNEKEINLLLNLHKNNSKSIEMLSNLKEHKEIFTTLKFVEIYNYMKKLSTKKTNFMAKKIDIFDITLWLKTLPFTPTKDQLNALDDIKSDFLLAKAAKRVIMGDVGSGKTLVMLGAALMAYPQNAILMAPTSILAEQIYSEAKRLLPSFMNVMLVKSGDKNLNFNGVNLIIGTHVLLYQKLPKTSLVMVDEQHRFGSNQRQKINFLTSDGRFRAHFLQFSATPIPRTLSLIQSSLVNFSFLKTLPYEKHIHTFVIQNDGFKNLINHIKKEINRGKQAIVVYPLVEKSEVSNYQSIDEAKDFWFKNFKNVYMTHGKDKDKEQILLDFRDKGSLLLTTTVVEVGISLPKLSIIVIVGAEKLGLASLHQLRGRVGRNGGDGWCYLYTKLKNIPSRLKEFSQTLDGFKVANIDLKNRQSGDILDGTIQHGATFEYYDMDENLAQMAQKRLNLLKDKNE
ncbi:ATP-dependent DNA helicase RecG [Campylobacter sp. RM12327]|uniref:ATP-dependent DNA helicase RecG n=1 Tax=Campylobacter sputorum TaxID=206 RepID=UPI000B77214A|nr:MULTISPECIES: ATP-dependent DNA helicase RecG [Campylobacter]ASM39764.1 ATP-dependent DNA helicase [Campylobacter sputorum]MBE7358034.1 ATP-dependent DNA helicase RecG [Campylobacter sp. RM11302]MBF6668846.1 ATP-dependent DNA helicase RecG [Campylobacter sp. RM12327]MBF6673760.1 ATP-dependent DNA helicase RecG [Campylobacter sp. RM13538]MBF6676225.1 ATP-dependent DNA helicase RecG [Campylobacter sp. RM12321]